MSRRAHRTIVVAIVCLSSTASADTDSLPEATPATLAARVAAEGDVGAHPLGAGAIELGGGWDDGREASFGRARAHVGVHRRVDLIGGASLAAGGERWRPSAGLRVQLLDERARAFDLAVSTTYKAEGFVEPEGELEVVTAIGRTFGGFRIGGDVAYGQDPEGNERDAEAALGASVPVGRLMIGAGTRGRVSLGIERDSAARWDVVSDVGVAASIGSYAVRLSSGLVVVGLQRTEVGATVGGSVVALF